MVEQPLIIAAEGRPCLDEAVSGDRWAVDWDGLACRVAVIDGLGHGPDAAQAAEAAVAALAVHPELPPDEALRHCHLALKGTRGAAISIARVEPEAGRLVFAGVGNVEARLWNDGTRERPIAFRGIVGATLPTIRTFTYTLEPTWLLLLHTDGVSARFRDDEIAELVRDDAQGLAKHLLERWSRQHDDAAVLVVRPRPDQR